MAEKGKELVALEFKQSGESKNYFVFTRRLTQEETDTDTPIIYPKKVHLAKSVFKDVSGDIIVKIFRKEGV